MQSTVARLWIFAFALLTCTHPAFSQDTGTSSIDQEEEGTICLPTKHVWHGSLVEIRNIERNPVPESFKKASGGGCGGYADPEELVQWHIRFGSEPSAKAALDFVDDRYGDPQKFGDKLTKNIAATGVEIAQELERAEQNANADDDVNEIAQRILQSGKWNLKLGQLYYQPWHLIRIANLYTMAAERFASPTLRDKAHSIFATYQKMSEATRLKAENDEWPDSVQKAIQDILKNSQSGITPMKVDLNLALLDTTIELSDANIATFSAKVESYAEPSYKFAGKLAFADGDDFCDFAKENVRNSWEQEFLDRCGSENWFEVNAVHYVYVSERLELFRGGSEWDTDEFLTIYQKDRKDNGNWRGYWDGLDERPVAMKLAIADSYIKQAKLKQPKRDQAWSDWDSYVALQRALDFCIEASEMFNPAHDPVRFRQLATRVTSIERQIRSLSEDDFRIRPQQMQSLAYIRINLGRLDDMVLGKPN